MVFGYLLVMNLKQNGHGDALNGIMHLGWPVGVAIAGHLIFRKLLAGVPIICDYSMLFILFFALAIFIGKQWLEDRKQVEQ